MGLWPCLGLKPGGQYKKRTRPTLDFSALPCHTFVADVPLGLPRFVALGLRSSISDPRSAISDPSAVCRRPLLRHQLSLVPAECKCKSSETCDRRPAISDQRSSDLRRHLYMHCLCCKPQKFEDRLNRESSVSDRRSWSSVFCIYLLFLIAFSIFVTNPK